MDPSPHPRRIGPYTIVDVIGEGGMGVVYLARQEEPVRRSVALKVLKQEHGSTEVLARFQGERQALAVMDHPSIAKIFDAGVTQDGRSWFAMERVEGEPITTFCDHARMPLRERIRLFARVCQAVQHAHQKGLIHRDLKPSNVLVAEVDGRPLPRIIDFGIAKATEAAEFDGTGLTRDDQVVGTPAYMSPEQVEGSPDIDTRSDVYSLGVLLYELLVGALPFDHGSYRGWAALAAALHREPPAPARRITELDPDTGTRVAAVRGTSVPELRRALTGDLDFIVARAMERDREERYETANALALELERWLNHEPVRARGDSRVYVARKFVRRNRLGVAFGATVAVGLVSFAITTAVQSARIQARQAQGEALIDFMLSDLRAKLEPLGRLDVLDEVGDQAVAYFASLPASEYTDAELASRSQALYQIGNVRLSGGSSVEARDAFAESLRLARILSERAPEDRDRLFGLSQSEFWVGYASWLADDLTEAELHFQAYLDMAERLVAMEPDNLDYRLELAYAWSNVGSVQEARGDLAAAEESFARTLEVKTSLVEADPGNVDWLGELAEEHNKLAVVQEKLGRYREALESHREEVRLKGRLLEMDPAQSYWRFRLAVGMGFAGDLERVAGSGEEAVRLHREQVAILDSLVAFDPANALWRRDAAIARRDLATILTGLGQPAAALPLLDEAAPLLEALLAADSTGYVSRWDVASVHRTRAMALAALGDGDAVAAAREAVALSGSADGALDRKLDAAWSRLALGHALAAAGEDVAAREAWAGALTLAEPVVSGPGAIQARPLMAELLLLLERPGAAELVRELAAAGYREPILRRLAETRLPGGWPTS